MKRTFLMGLIGTTAMVGAAMVALPNNADAALITQGGSTNISINQTLGGENVLLTGTITFATFNADQLVLDFNLTNNSNFGARMVSFGWDFDPAGNAAIDSISNNLTPGSWDTSVNSNISSGFTVDICAYAGQNCTGGGNQGLQAGQTLTGTMTVNGTFEAPLYFEQFVGRFQSVGTNNELSGAWESGNGTPPPEVPEPASLALLGVGLLGLGYAARRRKQAA